MVKSDLGWISAERQEGNNAGYGPRQLLEARVVGKIWFFKTGEAPQILACLCVYISGHFWPVCVRVSLKGEGAHFLVVGNALLLDVWRWAS